MSTPNNNLSHTKFMRFLRQYDACPPAREWVRKNKYDARTAYARCRNPHWLKWLFYHGRVTMAISADVSNIAWGTLGYPNQYVAACKSIRAKYKFSILCLPQTIILK